MHRRIIPPRPMLPRLSAHAITFYLVIGIAFYVRAMPSIARLRGGDDVTAGVDPISTYTQLLMLVGGIAIIWRYHRPALELLPRFWPFLLLLGLVMASALWSLDPGRSLRRSVAVATVMVFALAVLTTTPLPRLMRMIHLVILASGVLSLLVLPISPHFALDTGDYSNALRGLFAQKNGLGEALMLGNAALAWRILARGGISWRMAGMFLLSLVIIRMSRSTTALVLSLVAITLAVMLALLRRGGPGRALAALWALLGITLGLLAMIFPDQALMLIGKSTDLTGRTQIWQAVLREVALHPLLGYGYNAFWLPNSIPAQTVWAEVGWQAPSAHNGVIEVLAQVGWIGLAITLYVHALTLWRSFRGVLNPALRTTGLWGLIYLLLFVVFNFDEVALLRPDFWLFLIMVTTVTLRPPTPWFAAAVPVARQPARQPRQRVMARESRSDASGPGATARG